MLDHLQVPRLDPMVPRWFRVRRRREDTVDTVTLWLEPLDGTALAFTAGQFTMLSAFGIGEVPISISGDPGDVGLLQHTIRDVGGVTAALARSDVGAVLGVRGPFGTGWQAETGAGGDVLVVAGGIGLAPLRPAIHQVLARRDRFDRVSLLYGVRTPEDLLYPDELDEWAEEMRVAVTVDSAAAGYDGRVGLVTALLPNAGVDPQRTLALVCGPEVMMRRAAAELLRLGVAADRIRVSLERNMRCGIGLCGHCQLREFFLCVDGPVLSWDRVGHLLAVPEL